jgi:hypothetical protein
MIAALAFILLTIVAIQYDGIEWRKKVQRYRKNRKVRSFLLLHYVCSNILLIMKLTSTFFQFSKNFTKKFSLNY